MVQTIIYTTKSIESPTTFKKDGAKYHLSIMYNHTKK